MNSQGETTEKSRAHRALKTQVLLMVAIVFCLGILAIFANVQRSRHDIVEVVTTRSSASPTPQQR